MDDVRLTQLLGVLGLAAHDRVRATAACEAGHGGAAPAILVHLRAHPGGSVNDLSKVLAISQPATVRMVDRLAALRLVERRPGPDRRTVALALSEAGSAAADRVLARRRAALAPLLEPLGDEDRATLEGLLERLVAGLAADRHAALTLCRLCDRPACRGTAGCPLDHTVTAA